MRNRTQDKHEQHDQPNVETLSLRKDWDHLLSAPSGVSTFLRSSLSALNGVGFYITVAGTVVVFFPVILATLGLAVTSAVFLSPAILIGLWAGYREYRKLKDIHEAEAELQKSLLEYNNKEDADKKLKAIDASIDKALLLLELKRAEKPENDVDDEIAKDEKCALIEATLHSIESMRKIMHREDYRKEEYEALIRLYDEMGKTYDDKGRSFLPKQEKTGFFRGLYQDMKGFIPGLIAHGKEKGVGSAIGQFFQKTREVVIPFLSGMGLGLTLGAAGLGVATMALGTGLSFSGIGAIAGIPAFGVGLILLGVSVGFGLIAMGVKYYTKRQQDERMQSLVIAANALRETHENTNKLEAKITHVSSLIEKTKQEKEIAEQKKKIAEQEEVIAEQKKKIAEQEEKIAGLGSNALEAEKEVKLLSNKEEGDASIYANSNITLFHQAHEPVPSRSPSAEDLPESIPTSLPKKD